MLLFLLSTWFYAWTANASETPASVGSPPNYYGMLAQAFLNGQTSLLTQPSPELLALADPYDPEANYS